MGQFVVVEDRCHEAVVPALLVPVELDCLPYTGSRKYPRIPHQCHFGASPSVISSAARNLGQKTKISQSQPLTFVRGWLLRNDKGLDSVANKKGVSHHTTPYPRRCRGLLYCAPQERGSKPRIRPCGVERFCRGERPLALFHQDLLHRARFVILVPENKCEFHSG